MNYLKKNANYFKLKTDLKQFERKKFKKKNNIF